MNPQPDENQLRKRIFKTFYGYDIDDMVYEFLSAERKKWAEDVVARLPNDRHVRQPEGTDYFDGQADGWNDVLGLVKQILMDNKGTYPPTSSPLV